MGAALEYGGNNAYGARGAKGNYGNAFHNQHRAEARGLAVPESYAQDADFRAEARGLGMVDDARRGHFIPRHSRDPNAPVRVNRDIGPT
mmetsp:Transcript_5281/g.8915  ORF Transcript_5281/g.8915 Transcript_5281/m.8915 type:complete len:89 (-) Transcript_5281:236-502(-)